MTQLSMEEILADESAPTAEVAVEQMNPDERAVLEEAREAQATDTPAEKDADTPAAEKSEPEPEQATEPAAQPEADDLSDLPESIRASLAKRPEDADNWRNLREIARDAQKAAKEAAHTATEAAAERARLEAELATLRQAESERAAAAQAQAQRAALPDPEVDPAGYVAQAMAHEREQMRAEMRSIQLDTFEAQAKRTHGADKVDAAFKWAETASASDPALAAQIASATDPWDFVVRERDRRETLATLGDDPAATIEKIRQEAREAALAELQQQRGEVTHEAVEAELAKRLPRSLAKTPGAGGQAVSDGYAGPTPMGQILGGN